MFKETTMLRIADTVVSPAMLGDMLVLIFVLAFFSIIVGLINLFRKDTKQELPPELGRLNKIGGKVEKLDINVNELKTEVLRSSELLKRDVDEIKRLLGASSGSPGGSGPQGGETPDASGGGIVKASAETQAAPQTSDASFDAEEDRMFDDAVAEDLTGKLKKTRKGFLGKLKAIFSSREKIDTEALEELEALLVSTDLGIATASSLIEELKQESTEHLNESALKEILQGKVQSILTEDAPAHTAIDPEKESDGPKVVMVVGVNGAGKTTTVAKLASSWTKQGKKVLLVAADTFRAAAVQQLKSWGEKIGAPVVSGAENAKPQTVVFDAMERAQKESFDVVLIDTAGRLHTKSNLMQELEGVRNVIERHQASAPHETVLVVDGSTGQNAISQAREFNAAVPLTGLIITKLDGTPKGGVVVAIKHELGIPVRYIGVGESEKDLREFDAAEFSAALFDESGLSEEDLAAVSDSSAHAETRRRRRREEEAIVH